MRFVLSKIKFIRNFFNLIYNNIPLTKIIPIIIIGILCFISFDIKAASICVFSLLMLLGVRIYIYIYFKERYEFNYQLNYFSYTKLILMSIVGIVVFICSLINNQTVIYSLTVGVSVATFIDILPKNYYGMISFLLNCNYKNSVVTELNSFFKFKKVDSVKISSNDILKTEKKVVALSNCYSYYNLKYEKPSSSDYTVKVLKEFSSFMYPEDFSFSSSVSAGYEKYDVVEHYNDTLDYVALKKGKIIRIIVSGLYENLILKCGACAEIDNCSVVDNEHRQKIEQSVSVIRENGFKDISFAFCDIEDESVDLSKINNLIFVGTLGIEEILSDTAEKVINDIKDSEFSYIISIEEFDKDRICNLLNKSNIQYFELSDKEIIINKTEYSATAEFYNDTLNFKGAVVNCSNNNINNFLNEVKNVIDISKTIRQKNIVTGVSLMSAYLILSSMIPNSVMQPYTLVFISVITELLAFSSVKNFKGNKNYIHQVVNTFAVTVCGVLVFLAGRFFVEVPMSKFDAVSVNTARTMLAMFFILIVPWLDSVAIFSKTKSHKNNIMFVFGAVLICVLLQIPFIRDSFKMVAINFQAIKFLIFFVLIPALVEGLKFVISKK